MSDEVSPETLAAVARGNLLAASADALAVQARELLMQIFADAPEDEREALNLTGGIPLLVLATASGIVAKADGDMSMMDGLLRQAEAHLKTDVSLCHVRHLIKRTRGATVVPETAGAAH